MIAVAENPTKKPGCLRVLVTRPRHQAFEFIQLLKNAGVQTFELPCIDIVFKNKQSLSTEQKEHALRSNWWIFTSANAVSGAHECGLLPNNHSAIKVAAIGQATTRSLQKYAIPISFAPVENLNSEQLLNLIKLQIKQADKISIVRGDTGREFLKNSIVALGNEVHYLEVYHRQLPTLTTTETKQILISAMPCVISITSDLSLLNLLQLLPGSVHEQLLACPLVVNSERCAKLAKERGFHNRIQVACPPGDQGQLTALSAQHWFQNHRR